MTDITSDITEVTPDLSPMQIAQQVVKLEQLHREIKGRLDNMKSQLLAKTKELDVITLKTGSYTISRASRKTIKVLSKKGLAKELEGMGLEVLYAIDMDYMKPVVKNVIDKLEYATETETEYVSIRIAKPKGDT